MIPLGRANGWQFEYDAITERYWRIRESTSRSLSKSSMRSFIPQGRATGLGHELNATWTNCIRLVNVYSEINGFYPHELQERHE